MEHTKNGEAKNRWSYSIRNDIVFVLSIFFFSIPKQFVNYDYAFSIKRKKMSSIEADAKLYRFRFRGGEVENLIDGTEVNFADRSID